MHSRLAVGLTLLQLFAARGVATLDGSRYLWYDKPGTQWEIDHLPIGNGRIGATIAGGVQEIITITEDTIWSGPLQDRTPYQGPEALPVVRDLLVDGNITEAGNLTMQKLYRSDMGGMRAFSYFGNLNLAFGHSNNTENYIRSLDTKTGLSTVEYTVDGVDYR